MRSRHPQHTSASVTPAGRLIGYARVSTDDQDLRMQVDALERVGIHPDNLHTDKASGAAKRRPGLESALKDCVTGDTLVVWRLDRLGRSTLDLLTRIRDLEKRGVGFRSLSEAIDTKTIAGTLLLAVLGAVAQFERDLIRERTKTGMAAAKARGAKFGPKQVFNLAKAMEMFSRGASVEEVARSFPGSRGRSHMSRQAIYRYIDATTIASLQEQARLKLSRKRKRRR